MLSRFATKLSVLAALFLSSSVINAYKIAVINDIHIDLKYDPASCSGGDDNAAILTTSCK